MTQTTTSDSTPNETPLSPQAQRRARFFQAQRQAITEVQKMTDAQFGGTIRRLTLSTKLEEVHAAHFQELEAEIERLQGLVPEEPATNVSDFPSSGSA